MLLKLAHSYNDQFYIPDADKIGLKNSVRKFVEQIYIILFSCQEKRIGTVIANGNGSILLMRSICWFRDLLPEIYPELYVPSPANLLYIKPSVWMIISNIINGFFARMLTTSQICSVTLPIMNKTGHP